MLRRALLAISVLLVLVLAARTLWAADSTPQTFTVSGIVHDVYDARVQGAVVTFSSGQIVQSVTSNPAGEFTITLVRTRRRYNYSTEATGFCKASGKLSRKNSASSETLNIGLKVCPYEERDSR